MSKCFCHFNGYEVKDAKARNDIESLKGELVAINVKHLGVIGDGINDDTVKINEILALHKNIYFPDGVYMIDGEIGIQPQSNSKIILSNNTTLKVINNNLTHYDIIKLNGVSNITISGGTIEGDRLSHTGTEGEWGFCISVINSSNVYINNIKLINSWGDGLYINGGANINTQNIICDNNRRQGLSIISVDGYHSLNDRFINTNGTSPQAGVDIEPNKSTDILKNIVFDNPYTGNNSGAGIKLYLFNIETNDIDIKINNHIDNSSINGLNIGKSSLIKGRIKIDKPSYYNSKNSGIELRDCYLSECNVSINKPHIENCNTDNLSPAYVCGIGCYTNTTTELPMGNITIIEPYITVFNKETANKNAIYMADTTNEVPIENVKIINPINKQSNLRINFGYANNIVFEDKYENYISDQNANITIQNSYQFSKYYNKSFTSSRTLTIHNALPIGTVLEFIHNNTSYKNITITLPETNYARYFDYSNPGISIKLSTFGDRLKMKKVSDSEWEVLELLGKTTKVE